jgi:uncharacterized phiE125 gp8 family phage protein
MKTIITTSASGLVVPLPLVKNHLRLDSDDGSDDDLITHLINVATERAEHQLGRSLLTKTYKTIAEFGEKIKLTPNLISISSVVLTKDDNTTVNLVSGDYWLNENSLVPEIVPMVLVEQSIAVNYTAGYGTADNVPYAIKQWLLVDIATLYENREAVMTYGVNSVPYAFVDGLLDPFRVQY